MHMFMKLKVSGCVFLVWADPGHVAECVCCNRVGKSFLLQLKVYQLAHGG